MAVEGPGLVVWLMLASAEVVAAGRDLLMPCHS